MGQRQSEIIKNHMEVYWHDYASASKGVPITEAGLVEKASVIGRTGLMLLECGTGAWRVRSSMNTLSRELGVTTTADIGLLSIEFTCFDGDQCYTQSLCLTNTGVNTSRLNRLEHFVNDFDREGKFMTGEELHSHLDEIERIHGLYSPIALGFAAALACGCFTFLLGGGIVEMLCAFCGAGIGNFVRCKLTKHHFTLFLGITASVCSASLVYAILLKLAVTTTADIGLLSIEFTCFDGDQCYTQSLCLTNTGVNTSRLNRLEHFVNDFDREGKFMTGEELHSHLDEIERIHGLYSPIALGFAAALACGCFTFLLGGGIVEMLCAFCGAGIGNFVRCKLTKHHFTLFLGITASVCSASLVYAILLKLAEVLFAVSAQHEAGYICSMLFIIPGFPFITSGIDLAKLDMRSGLERLAYAVLIILVATMTAWIMALLLHLQPVQFPALSLTLPEEIVFRLLASFGGVFGFSLMFNSPRNLAVCAALIGAVTNTFRLELVSLAGFPPAIAAFLGALLSGLLASCLKSAVGYPRISVTVPSIVIMVPGLYFYRAIYNLGILSLMDSATWFADAILIIVALPLGLIFARIVTDKTFRYCT